MKKKTKYTDKDLKEFDRLVSLMDSQNQMDRIHGRLTFYRWKEKFTEETIDQMWQIIKDW